MKTTLSGRITAITIVFAVALISAFTIVQLQNQLRVITIFNSLKAKLTAQILKDALEKAIRERTADETPEEALAPVLSSLLNSELIDTAFVYSANDTIIASTHPMAMNKAAPYAEKMRMGEARTAAAKGKRFASYIEKDAGLLQLYIPVSSNGEILYVARLDFSLANVNEAMEQVYIPVILTAMVVIVATIIFGIMLSKKVIVPITILNQATKEVAAGDLDLRIHMKTNDELEELSDTFNYMTVELKKMKAKAENANPLTKLPGNIVIREEVENRIKHNKKFMVIYCDLDNFKAFNDNYGIHTGDDAIKLTADIFKEAIEAKGNQNDFIGHEGGDDFILLTTPDKAKALGDYITSEFDKRIRSLYNKEDLGRGYIEAKARVGDEVFKFPITTISLAGVTNDIRPIASYGEVTNIAAEVKKKAKMTEGSCLFIDKRSMPYPPGVPRPT
jgi:diguanylate cyclase (GGDEF)-like protein